MKKPIILTLLLIIPCLTVFAAADGLFSYIPYKSASWVSYVTIESSDGVKQEYTQNVSFKPGKMRMEGKMKNASTGEAVNQLILMSDKNMYLIDADKKTGTKFSMDSALNPEKYREAAAKYRKNAKKTGSETIDGIACGIYSYDYFFNDAGEPMHMKEWRAKDGFIYKSTSENKDMKTTSVVKDLRKNIQLSDLLFEPEKDIQVTDMDSVMKAVINAGKEDEENKKATVKTDAKKMDKQEDEDTGEAVKKAVEKEGADAAKDMIKGMFGQ